MSVEVDGCHQWLPLCVRNCAIVFSINVLQTSQTSGPVAGPAWPSAAAASCAEANPPGIRRTPVGGNRGRAEAKLNSMPQEGNEGRFPDHAARWTLEPPPQPPPKQNPTRQHHHHHHYHASASAAAAAAAINTQPSNQEQNKTKQNKTARTMTSVPSPNQHQHQTRGQAPAEALGRYSFRRSAGGRP